MSVFLGEPGPSAAPWRRLLWPACPGESPYEPRIPSHGLQFSKSGARRK
jgi:hypothetical protein